MVENKNVNIHRTGGAAEMHDNPVHGETMNYISGHEYIPVKHVPQFPSDWKVALVYALAKPAVVGLGIGAALLYWNKGYCGDFENYAQCLVINTWGPLVFIGAGSIVAGLVVWQWVAKQRIARQLELAEAQRVGLARDRFGNLVPARLFENASVDMQMQLHTWQTWMATELKAKTAQWEQWGGSNSGVNTVNYTEGAKVESSLSVEQKPLPALPDGMKTNDLSISDMVSAGYVRGSDYSLLLGLDENNTPVQWDWSLDGGAGEPVIAAMAGAQGMGKTYCARTALAIAAHKGIRLMLCDGQGESNNKQTLLYDVQDLKEAFLDVPATNEDTILRAIYKVWRIMEDRAQGIDKSIDPVLLVLDEFSYLMTGNERAEEIAGLLLKIGQIGRKFNVRALLIGQSWRADIVGSKYGSSLRNQIRLKVIFGIDPMEIKFLTYGLANDKLTTIDQLKTGQAYVYSPNAMTMMKVPTVQSDMMTWVGQRIGAMGTVTGRVQPHTPSRTSNEPAQLLEGLLTIPATRYATEEMPKNGQNGVSHCSVARSKDDVEERMCEWFVAGMTQREVRNKLNDLGLEMAQNEFPRIQRKALGK